MVIFRVDREKEEDMKKERFEELKKEYFFSLAVHQNEEVVRVNHNMSRLKKNPSLFAEIKEAKPQIIAFLKEEIEAKKEREAEAERISNNAKIVGYIMKIGCDAGNTKRFLYDAETSYHRDQQDQKLVDEIFILINSDLAESLGGKALEPDMCSYGGWEFDEKQTAILIQMAQKVIDEKQKKKEEKEKEVEEKEAEIFAIAKKTNEKQLIKSFPIECQDINEECDIDWVCVYAMPDGTKTEIISHTW